MKKEIGYGIINGPISKKFFFKILLTQLDMSVKLLIKVPSKSKQTPLKFMNNNHILSSLISRFAFSFIQNNSSLKSILLENVIGLNNYAFRR